MSTWKIHFQIRLCFFVCLTSHDHALYVMSCVMWVDGTCFVFQAKEKYEKSLEEVSGCSPQYMENMEVVFEQCQQFEEKRLNFLREILLDIKRHLNLTESQRWQLNLPWLYYSNPLTPLQKYTLMELIVNCTVSKSKNPSFYMDHENLLEPVFTRLLL